MRILSSFVSSTAFLCVPDVKLVIHKNIVFVSSTAFLFVPDGKEDGKGIDGSNGM